MWNKVYVASLMMSTAILTSGYEGEDQGLKVETTFKPNNCDGIVTKSGDELEMTTRGQSTNLLQLYPGKKFDSSHDRD